VKNSVFRLINLLDIAVAASFCSVSLLSSVLILTAISLILFTANLLAVRRPLTIICELTPSSTNAFASFKISPARTTTDVVPSPTSASCDLAISVNIRAAGWTMSNSYVDLCVSRTAPLGAMERDKLAFITVAPSFVIVCFPLASTNKRSPPYGPRVVLIVFWTAKQALMLEMICPRPWDWSVPTSNL